MKHLINSQDLDRSDYDEIFRRAKKFVDEGISPDICRGKIAATLFFQPSTRTAGSFQSAMIRAGGGYLAVSGEQGISMEKGESLDDTITTFGSLADVIVLRHPDEDSAERAKAASAVPVINGGSGSKEHAVGAAMMLYDWFYHSGRPLEGLKVGLYGTPEINRVCKSLIPVMGMYKMSLVVDDLGHFPVPKQVEEDAVRNGLVELRYDKLDNFIGDVDVLVVTRGLQKGIIPENKFPKEKEELILKSYLPINTEHMKRLRPDAVLSMITPRIFEIEKAVDSDPRALYMKREPFMEIGLAVVTYLLDIDV
ncbi:MAG: hypothetical protein WCL23_01620 [Candidatus Moraniibacteriota bacterium]